jgi:hypothetical protein
MKLVQNCVVWWAVLNLGVLLSRLTEIVLLFVFVEFYIKYKYCLDNLLIKLNCVSAPVLACFLRFCVLTNLDLKMVFYFDF